MNTSSPSAVELQPFVPQSDAFYSIDVASRLAQMPRHRILVCCRRGIVTPAIDSVSGRYYFDGATIRILQRIEYLGTQCGINYTGIEIILRLVDELERVRGSGRFFPT